MGPAQHSDRHPSPTGVCRSKLRDVVGVRLSEVVTSLYAGRFEAARGLGKDFDVMWVSFGPHYMIDVAQRLSRLHPATAVVIDVRDHLVQQTGRVSTVQRKAELSRLAVVERLSTGITTVSPELLYRPHEISVPMATISNGFHPEAAGGEVRRDLGDGVLRLYYGGAMYPDRRLDVLVAACAEISRQRPIQVHYAGRHFRQFARAFTEQGLDGLLVDHGFLPRADALRLQREAHVAVLLSWNNQEKGVMTGKVYELIAGNVPILCLVSGDHATSGLADLFAGDPTRCVFSPEATPENVTAVKGFIERAPKAGVDSTGPYGGAVRYRHLTYSDLGHRLSTFLERCMRVSAG